MAGKRVASSDLNHDNWNQEVEPEPSGSFSKASDDVLKTRVIKVAKRRNPIGSITGSEREQKPNAFANFGGFEVSSSTAPSSSTSSPFSFLSSLNKTDEQPKTNGISNTSSIIKMSSSGTPIFQATTLGPVTTSIVTDRPEVSKDYYAKLKGLNESVARWVNQHVNANPFINLTPVFRDYEKYINDLESSQNVEKEKSFAVPGSSGVKPFKSDTSRGDVQKEPSTFSIKPSDDNKSSFPTNITGSKSLEADKKSEGSKATQFNFQIGSLPKPSSSFSFGGAATQPFTFTNVSKPTSVEEENVENDDEDEPPKVEFTPVQEEGHIFKSRCKLFIKKDGKFTDRGVGNLFLKPIVDSDKVQLIMRADTSLGNLLCNLILSPNIAMQRLGKKDVMLVCIPTPESKPPPVPILFRVKSSEEADELLTILEKHKK